MNVLQSGGCEATKGKTQDYCNKTARLFNAQQLDFERQVRVWWDCRRATSRAVSQIAWDYEPAFASYFHTCEAFVPTLDNSAKLKLSRRTKFVGVIKLCAVFQPANVVNLDRLSHSGAGPISDFEILYF